MFILIILEQQKNASRYHIAMQIMSYPIRQVANNSYAIKIFQTILISVHLQARQNQVSIDQQQELA